MKHPFRLILRALLVSILAAVPLAAIISAEPETPADAERVTANLPNGPDEARGRARILHETIHGALQVMHRDFFVDDENLSLPSQSLQDVFKELTRQWGIELKWLGVNAKTMDSDHKPEDRFEERAVEALASGRTSYEAIESNVYRHAGRIKLQNECLKCHVPDRKTLEDRAAGLVINIPFREKGS